MKKKLKLFASLASLCLSLAVLCFGVYAAISVNYTVSGNVSYQISDVMVSVDTYLYRSTYQYQVPQSILYDKVNGIVEDITTVNFIEKVDDYQTETVKSYDNGAIINGGGIVEQTSSNIPINYGLYAADNNLSYAFYVVVEIENFSEKTIKATVTNQTENEELLNSIITPEITIQIPGKQVGRTAIGFALKDPTVAINGSFSYLINITNGALSAGTLSVVDNTNFETVENQSKDPQNATYLATGTAQFDQLSQALAENPTAIYNFDYTNSGKAKINMNIALKDSSDVALTPTMVLAISNNYQTVLEAGSAVMADTTLMLDTEAVLEENVLKVSLDLISDKKFCIVVAFDEDRLVQEGSDLIVKATFTTTAEISTEIKSQDLLNFTFIEEQNCFSVTQGEILAQEITIPSTYLNAQDGEIYPVKIIGSSAFMLNNTITTINMPDSITQIEQEAFDGCSNLTTVNLSNNLISIGYSAFNATNINTIELPASLQSIGYDANSDNNSYIFGRCTNLTQVKFLGSTPPTGTDGLFWDKASDISTVILVPNGSYDAYVALINSNSTINGEYQVNGY